MDPNKWGPKAWYFIHSVALAYPESPTEQDKEHYKTFFTNLGHILPCSVCQEHYRNNINEEELTHALKNRVSLFHWTVDIHNKVNEMTNKPFFSYKDTLESLYNDGSMYKDIKWIILFLLIVYVMLDWRKLTNK
jgi:hypothetical protein